VKLPFFFSLAALAVILYAAISAPTLVTTSRTGTPPSIGAI
jgi:hypothetical protein